MTPLGELLRDRIRRSGPMPFGEFMRAALYDPAHGYYRKPRDPFGRRGDFYTAEQIQPVFGILIAARIREMFHAMGSPGDFTVVELGAGRAEMAPAFAEWRYRPVDFGAGELPEHFHGVVFANEFFDALPVDAAAVVEGVPRERLVGFDGERFVWITGDRAGAAIEDYWRRYCPQASVFEANLEALAWMERAARTLAAGFVFTVDYGYVTREHIRFPHGTLMSYRRHTAREDVLADPGEQDITSHVPFSALEERGAACGLQTVAFTSLAQALLRAGEGDQFAAALAGASPADELRRRLQLKSLLFGMGETFRTLIQRKATK